MELKNIKVHAGGGSGSTDARINAEMVRYFTGTGRRSGA